MGQVIRMDSVPRSTLPSSYDDVLLEGFRRALRTLDAVKICSMRETIIALEHWAESGLLSEAEVDEMFTYHGWRRS